MQWDSRSSQKETKLETLDLIGIISDLDGNTLNPYGRRLIFPLWALLCVRLTIASCLVRWPTVNIILQSKQKAMQYVGDIHNYLCFQVLVQTRGGDNHTANDALRLLQDLNLTQQVCMRSHEPNHSMYLWSFISHNQRRLVDPNSVGCPELYAKEALKQGMLSYLKSEKVSWCLAQTPVFIITVTDLSH